MIDYSLARKMAGQALGWKGLCGMKTNREGAYFFCAGDGSSLLLIDDRTLDAGARKALANHLGPLTAYEICDRGTGQMLDFITPIAGPGEAARQISPGQTLRKAPVWHLHDDSWCLGLIHAGIRAGNQADREALALFDERFARSAHERISARKSLSRHKSAVPAGKPDT